MSDAMEQQQNLIGNEPQVFELRCGVQLYEWGKLGQDSEVAALKASADPDFRISPEKKYAELWMGTHPNCPSTVVRPGQQDVALLDWIRQHPDSLGTKPKDYFNGCLSFLFKVLSVRTSLSIQAHPNKVHAEMLHQKQPELYKDPNHKPELAIALTAFNGLCGFRPIKEIADFMMNIEEFRNAVGRAAATKLITSSHSQDMASHRECMKECFTCLMDSPPDMVKKELNNLVYRVNDMKERGDDLSSVEGDIILKLDREFRGDPGAFCVYFLNSVRLQPGEAMFLDANLPHAYLSGDCMECMACSDNVVRAGLTSKYIDKHTLVEMLDYSGRTISHTKFVGIHENGEVKVTMFRPPVPDFAVTRVSIPKAVKRYTLHGLDSASLCIVIHGSGTATNATLPRPLLLRKGCVFFMAAMQEADILVTGNDDLLLFRAYSGLL